jgi:hypothetical protein
MDDAQEFFGRAVGGRAANAKRTPEERKALAEKMVAAKRELALLPRATHSGTLKQKFRAQCLKMVRAY